MIDGNTWSSPEKCGNCGNLVVNWATLGFTRSIKAQNLSSCFHLQFCDLHRVVWTFLCIYLLTYSMEQNPSWEANSFSASQQITRILWKPKVHCRTHKCSLTVSQRYTFFSDELLAPRQTPKLEDHPLSGVRGRLFNTFVPTLHIGGPLNLSCNADNFGKIWPACG